MHVESLHSLSFSSILWFKGAQRIRHQLGSNETPEFWAGGILKFKTLFLYLVSIVDILKQIKKKSCLLKFIVAYKVFTSEMCTQGFIHDSMAYTENDCQQPKGPPLGTT